MIRTLLRAAWRSPPTGGRVFFDVTASDAAGNTTRVRGEIALKPRKARR